MGLDRRARIAIASLFVVCVLIIAGCLIYMEVSKNQIRITSGSNRNVEYRTDAATITYEGQKYKYNTDIKSVLFIGVDKTTALTAVTAAGNGGQSDALLLLIMNTADKTARILEISRNTMVDVDMYDLTNEYFATQTAQITMQYAYGDGGIRSCQYTKDKVSELLHQIPIRSYVALNIEGIYAIVDAMDGIPITIDGDYTEIDESFADGEKLVLDGELTEKFVRSRDTNTYGSNTDRMQRQSQFIDAFLTRGKELLKGNSNLISNVVKAADDCMLTDMDLDTMQQLSEYEISREILELPGEETHGERYDEFYPDEEKLEQLLIELFYKAA